MAHGGYTFCQGFDDKRRDEVALRRASLVLPPGNYLFFDYMKRRPSVAYVPARSTSDGRFNLDVHMIPLSNSLEASSARPLTLTF